MNRTKRLKGVCSECGGPIDFPAELIGTTAPCPRCRKPTDLLLPTPPDEPLVPRKVIIWTAVTIAVLIVGAIGLVLGLRHIEKLAARKKGQAVPPTQGRVTNSASAVSQQPLD